jgi:hypothetical protein
MDMNERWCEVCEEQPATQWALFRALRICAPCGEMEPDPQDQDDPAAWATEWRHVA